MLVISALRRAGQDDAQCKASLGYTASPRSTWATQGPVSKTKIDIQREVDSDSMVDLFLSMYQILISIHRATKKKSELIPFSWKSI